MVAVTSDDRPQLQCAKPPNWDRFTKSVEEKWGVTHPYVGFEIDLAWREFDEEHPAEDYADRLLGAVRRRSRDTRERNLLTRGADGTGDGRVWTRVHPETKEEMQAAATEAGVPVHAVLRGVLWWYLDGGLLSRVTEKLEQAVPEAETQLAELDPGDDRERTAVEKKRDWLANWVKENRPGGFNADDFGTALEEQPWGGSDSEHMREEHLQPVLDRLEFTNHPAAGNVYIPEEDAEEIAEQQGIDPDAPAFERKPYDDLTDDERAHGLRVELARRAAGHGGKRALRTDRVRGEVFDGTPGTRKVKDLMDRAADGVPGFETDAKGGTKRLRCGLESVADADLLADADLTAGTVGTGPDEPDANPGGDAVDTEGTDPETAANEEVDALMAATPVTDGGEEQP